MKLHSFYHLFLYYVVNLGLCIFKELKNFFLSLKNDILLEMFLQFFEITFFLIFNILKLSFKRVVFISKQLDEAFFGLLAFGIGEVNIDVLLGIDVYFKVKSTGIKGLFNTLGDCLIVDVEVD